MHSDELMRGPELREGLELDLPSHPELSPTGRVVWLATNLEEYVGRLVGFGMFPHTTLESLVRGVLFSMVVVASELMAREMENALLPAPLRSDWQILSRRPVGIAGEDGQTRTRPVDGDHRFSGCTGIARGVG